jgi:hypothetical protein
MLQDLHHLKYTLGILKSQIQVRPSLIAAEYGIKYIKYTHGYSTLVESQEHHFDYALVITSAHQLKERRKLHTASSS